MTAQPGTMPAQLGYMATQPGGMAAWVGTTRGLGGVGLLDAGGVHAAELLFEVVDFVAEAGG